MKTLTLLTAIILTYSANGSADCLSEVNQTKVKAALAFFNGSYADVPASINCKKPGKNDELVCSNPTLMLMAELDDKAAVYAYENATHTEISHNSKLNKRWMSETLNRNKSPEALCDAFKNHTNENHGDSIY